MQSSLDQVPARLARNIVALRHARGLTQAELAKSAGLPRSTIAHLESGEGNPSLSVLLKTAEALSVSIDALLAPAAALVRHYRSADIPVETKGGRARGVSLRSLVPEPVGAQMELMSIDKKGVFPGTPHLPGTREFFTLLEGSITIVVEGQRYELREGDVLAFPGHARHAYQGGDRPSRGVSIVVRAPAGV